MALFNLTPEARQKFIDQLTYGLEPEPEPENGAIDWICKLPAGFVIMSTHPLVVRNDTGIDAYVVMFDGEKIRVNRGEEKRVWPVDIGAIVAEVREDLAEQLRAERARAYDQLQGEGKRRNPLIPPGSPRDFDEWTVAMRRDIDKTRRQTQAAWQKDEVAEARFLEERLESMEDKFAKAKAQVAELNRTPEPRLLGVFNDPNGGGVRKVTG